MQNTNVYLDEEQYPQMTLNDAEKIQRLNGRRGWSVTYPALRELVYRHRRARSKWESLKSPWYRKEMSLIEYRLTDINYHEEVAMLREGKYKELLHNISEGMRAINMGNTGVVMERAEYLVEFKDGDGVNRDIILKVKAPLNHLESEWIRDFAVAQAYVRYKYTHYRSEVLQGDKWSDAMDEFDGTELEIFNHYLELQGYTIERLSVKYIVEW